MREKTEDGGDASKHKRNDVENECVGDPFDKYAGDFDDSIVAQEGVYVWRGSYSSDRKVQAK